ncbi:MAG TPA: 3-deoxy-7-phosphoheptulonate synthase [Bacteroidales bacterium]|nr:3-deoxy-7-phosphoheptulonate synthase [Bacteroidales bacterium]
MILHLKNDINQSVIKEIIDKYNPVILNDGVQTVLVTSSSFKDIEDKYKEFISKYFVFDTDIQLANIKYASKRKIQIGKFIIGGDSKNTLLAAGPCSVESWEQIRATAELLKSCGLSTLRAGSFKPRTSPYTFQGLGIEGLQMLDAIRKEYGFTIITEVRDATHADVVIEYADVIQIGAKAMYDHGILRKCGNINKPILLKRHFGANIQEFVQAAEFILSGGNPNVILCERGIRTFETKTRFTLDLCGVAYLKQNTNLPIILDPSHAMGYAYGIPDLTRASLAMGVDGLLIEVHPSPVHAKSDASQQLNHEEFKKLYDSLLPIANSIGRTII